jgi:hypothetical protein
MGMKLTEYASSKNYYNFQTMRGNRAFNSTKLWMASVVEELKGIVKRIFFIYGCLNTVI